MNKLIAWVEIPATNFERAVKFYNSALNLNLHTIDCGKEKMACFPGNEGAISYAPDFKPSENGTLVSFNTEKDLDGTIERVKANGGIIVQSKTKIEAEGRGYFALFIDSEGNKVGLYGDN
jgi:predicted enzyme related to lactoylglutathione lyase